MQIIIFLTHTKHFPFNHKHTYKRTLIFKARCPSFTEFEFSYLTIFLSLRVRFVFLISFGSR